MRFITFIKKASYVYGRVEDTLIAIFMTSVVLISVGQILLRWLHINGLVWADGFMRYSVLWIAMIGAAIAARDYQHITVDIPRLIVKGKKLYLARAILDFISAAIAVLLIIASWQNFQNELEMEQMAFANITTAEAIIIMPYCFLVITVRFIIYGVRHVRYFIHPELLPKQAGDELLAEGALS